MADKNAFYSYQGQEPQPLPHEISWIEEWGPTTFRTGVESFTEDELTKAGYTGPYTIPEFDPKIEELSWNSGSKKWSIIPRSYEDFWENLREERNNKLSESDWTQLPDSPLTSAKQTEWKIYRQELRDLPINTENPIDVIWPIEPK